MDQIIRFFIQNRYDDLEKFLEDLGPDQEMESKIAGSEFVSLIGYFTCLLEVNMIDDKQAFQIIFLLLKNKVHVNDFEYIDQHLVGLKKYPFTHRLLKTSVNLYVTEKNIDVILHELRSTKGKVGSLFEEEMKPDQIDKIMNGEVRSVVNSFHDIHFLNTIRNNNKNPKLWESICSREIHERLMCLMRLFGNKLLNFMDLPLIPSSEYFNYTHKQKIEYYLTCIGRLNFGLRTIDRVLKNRDRLQQKIDDLSKIYIFFKSDNDSVSEHDKEAINYENENENDDIISEYFE